MGALSLIFDKFSQIANAARRCPWVKVAASHQLAVQFDDHCLCLRATMMDEVSMVTLGTASMDKVVSSITHTEIWLAYGWHEFDAFDFLPVTGEL